MKKRILSFLLALILCIPAAAATEQANPFTDVSADAYYEDAVLWALEEGVTTGVTADQFQPDGPCTRGQVATFLWRAKGKPEPTIANPFKDVAETSPFYKAILWAFETGITTGVTPDTFNPNGTCTGAHVLTFLWRANGCPVRLGNTPLADAAPADAYYKDALAWAEVRGLLEGVENFAVSTRSPRAHIVTFLHRDDQAAEAEASNAPSGGENTPSKPAVPDGTVLYQYTFTDTTYDIDNPHIDSNSTQGWARTDVLNGDWANPFQVMRIYNNLNSGGGLPEGEPMTIDFHKMPDIDTKTVNAVHLSFKHIRIDNDGDQNIKQMGRLKVEVSTDNGKTWKSRTAGLLSYDLQGAINTMDGRQGLYYDVTTEDLASLVNEGEVITNVRLKPYGESLIRGAAFRIHQVTLTAYDKALTASDAGQAETIYVDGDTLRELAVSHMYDICAIEWTCDKDIDTMNYSNVGGNSTPLPMLYYANILHKGPVYTRAATSSLEAIEASIVNGKYTGPVDADGALGMRCSSIVFDCLSRFCADNRNAGTSEFVGDDNTMKMVAPLYNTDGTTSTPTILARFDNTTIWQHYANALPGDVPVSRPDNEHSRMVTADPVVVRNADGTINPDESYILMTEAGGSVYYYWQKPDGSTVRSKTNPAEYQKDHPNYTLLYGASARVDEKYTFSNLRKNNYVIMSPIIYETGIVEKLNLTATAVTEPEDMTDGFLAYIQTNYRIISTTATITRDGETVYEQKDMQSFRVFDMAYRSTQLNSALSALPTGDYTLTLDVQSGPVLTKGGEVPTNRVLTVNFSAENAGTDDPNELGNHKLDIVKGTYPGGADLGFNVTGLYLCFRMNPPAGTDWKANPVDYTVVFKDAEGKNIISYSMENKSPGYYGNSGMYQIGKTEDFMENGYTLQNVRGLTDVTAIITFTEQDGTVWTANLSGLTIEK